MTLLLQTVDAHDAALARCVGFGRRLALAAAGAPLFTLTLAPARSEDIAEGDKAVTDLATDAGPLRLFDAQDLLCLLGSVAPPAGSDAQALAVLLSLSRWPRPLTDALGMPSLLARGLPVSGPAMQLTLQREDVCLRALAVAPAGVWLRLAEAMAPVPQPAAARWPVAWPLVVGRAQLPLSQLRGLAVGDVVRLREPAFDANGDGTLALGGVLAQVRLVGPNGARRLEVLSLTPGVPSMQTTTAPDSQPDSQPANPPTSPPTGASPVDALPLTLVAELGTLRSSVGALQSLAPGSVLEIGERHPGEVTLRLQDGAALAHGELVDVAGRLGVRITRLAALP